ncbi:MAG: hypothetical protein ABEK04_02495, partial [Candidatus Nanohalobium sp.]
MISSFYLQQPQYLLVALLGLIGVYMFLKASDIEGRILGVTRFLFFVLLAVAIASPYLQDQRTVQTQSKLVVLQDSSNSADLINNYSVNIKGASIEKRTILRGNNSNLGSALSSELREGTHYLLVSDGRATDDLENTLGKYKAKNSTISVLKPEITSELSVYITGPSVTVPGANNKFTVHVSSTTTKKIPLKVTLDNETVFDGEITGSWSFNRSFSSRGNHKLKASIQTEDRFKQNNRYYKDVEVREKPEVLFIGKKSGLTEKISRFYDLTIRESLPEDFSNYYAVISSKALNSPELATYISKGNGYMYLGGYSDPASYLPVEASSENYDTESTRVVIGIETSSQVGSSIKDSKDLAYALVNELPLNTKVAAFVYSQDAHILSDLTTLAYNKQSLLNKISRVNSIAETRHGVGLKAAKQLANGKGNIVIFTDGNFFDEKRKSKPEIKRDAFKAAESIDVNLYIVGVGKNPNRDFLTELAERANGDYVDASNVWRLGFKFGAGGGTSAYKPLAVMEPDHFITEGLNLDSSVSLFNEVKPKPVAETLVSGPGQREFLTSWNYGLGRVAAFSGGQPTLSRITNQDPALVSRTVSWTVGNPSRKQEKWIEVSETEAPGKVEVRASYPVEGLTYSFENRYTGKLEPEGLGFHSFSGEVYGYNYNSEIKKIGYRDRVLERIASSTGGKIYTPESLN